MSVWAVIVAAGTGSRMGIDEPKVMIDVNFKPALWWTIKAFNSCEDIQGICLVSSEEIGAKADGWNFKKLKINVSGGNSRGESVLNGLNAIPKDIDFVAIHDGARACVTNKVIVDSIESAQRFDSGISGVPMVDTLHRVDEDNYVINTPNREDLWTVQTPQTFSYKLILDAYDYAIIKGFKATDDASVIINYGKDVRLVIGDRDNIKLTTKDDVVTISNILIGREKPKVGIGYDTHLLVNDRNLILGGVKIPFEKGLLGHSDADVLTHAIMDSILGAAGMRDIGQLFPDDNDDFKGASSIVLLKKVLEKVNKAGFRVSNIDGVIICQQPKIAPHRDRIISALAKAIDIPLTDINIKATTTEGANAEGRGEAVSAQVVASLVRT